MLPTVLAYVRRHQHSTLLHYQEAKLEITDAGMIIMVKTKCITITIMLQMRLTGYHGWGSTLMSMLSPLSYIGVGCLVPNVAPVHIEKSVSMICQSAH